MFLIIEIAIKICLIVSVSKIPEAGYLFSIIFTSERTNGWPVSAVFAAAAAAKSFQSYGLYVTPIDGSPPGYTVPVILQARTLEWVAISFSNA